MPRRPAPTALRLADGPTPARGEPRHALPAPPLPVFQPKTITKPRSSSSASLGSRRAEASALPFIGPDPSDKGSVDGVMFEPMSQVGLLPQWDTRPIAASTVPRKMQPGPWDRTRVNALSQEKMTELIAVPKPVAANSVQLW